MMITAGLISFKVLTEPVVHSDPSSSDVHSSSSFVPAHINCQGVMCCNVVCVSWRSGRGVVAALLVVVVTAVVCCVCVVVITPKVEQPEPSNF